MHHWRTDCVATDTPDRVEGGRTNGSVDEGREDERGGVLKIPAISYESPRIEGSRGNAGLFIDQRVILPRPVSSRTSRGPAGPPQTNI